MIHFLRSCYWPFFSPALRRGLRIFFFLSSLLFPSQAVIADTIIATYPLVAEKVQQQFDTYYLALMRLALDKSGADYKMIPYSITPITESRSEYNLKHNRYNIHWLHASPKRESDLIPIRIPLFKGLSGWRIFLYLKAINHDLIVLKMWINFA
jgi:hypothetical protein